MASCSRFKGRVSLQFSPKYTVHHSCSVFGKDWSLLLALLQTQKAMSNCHQSIEWSLSGKPRNRNKADVPLVSFEKALGWKLEYLQLTSTLMDEDLRSILPSSFLKSAEHLCFMSSPLRIASMRIHGTLLPRQQVTLGRITEHSFL